MHVWKRRLTVLVAALGAVGMLMSSAEAREPRERDGQTLPSVPGSITFPPFPPTMPPQTTSSTTPPPTMPPSTTSTTPPPPTIPPTSLPDATDDVIEDVIEQLEEFGDEFQELIDFLSNPFGV